LNQSGFVKSFNESKIRKKNKGESMMSKIRIDQGEQSEIISELWEHDLNVNEEKKVQKMCLSDKTLSLNNQDPKEKTKDLSSISQCSEFVIKNSIQNSIFNPNDYFWSDKNDEDFLREKIGSHGQGIDQSNLKNNLENKKSDSGQSEAIIDNIKIVDLDNQLLKSFIDDDAAQLGEEFFQVNFIFIK
jgi:hypothetical protein